MPLPGSLVVKKGSKTRAWVGSVPSATAATITPDGWLKTGDAGYLDDKGYIYLYDRVKDMIVSGGENVYSAEVEEALYAHPQVAEAAVVGMTDPLMGEDVLAFVVAKTGASGEGAKDISLIVVEAGTPGFSRATAQ